MDSFEQFLDQIEPASRANLAQSIERQSRLTKPPYALGELENIANKYASIVDEFPPKVPEAITVAVFAGDHGVLEEGVSPWPKEVTMQMLGNFIAGGAAINAIARQVGAEVTVVDVGVDGDTSAMSGVVNKKISNGTSNLALGPAMSLLQAKQGVQAGFEVGNSIIDAGSELLVTGDMGIGNTTPSAALISWFVGSDVETTTGRGTGIDDQRMKIKITAIESSHDRLRREGVKDPLEVLASIGGYEIAALSGYILAAAVRKVPLVLDGVIANAAAIVAHQLNPNITDYLFAGHLSKEPGAAKALEYLELEPILKLDLRLGEGTGGCLSVPIIQAAVRTLVEMATFESAGVSENLSTP